MMRLGGILQTKNYTDRYRTIQTLRQLTDCVIVLDDNSDGDPLVNHTQDIDVIISLRHRQLWNCQANRTMLLYQAWVNHCDWVMRIDDDMILSKTLRSRESINSLIATATRRGNGMIFVELRDLWDSYDAYRADDVWKPRFFPILQRVWFGDENITLKNPDTTRLHKPCWPANIELKRDWADPAYLVYHTGNISKEARSIRYQKYMKEDARQEFEGYALIINEDGVCLNPVPPEDKWNGESIL